MSTSLSALLLQVLGEAAVSRKLIARVTFSNPLPVTLKGGVFTLEGAGLTPAREIPALYVFARRPADMCVT